MHDLFEKYRIIPLTAAFILFWTPVLIFTQLADEILEGEHFGLDVTILEALNALSTPFLDVFFFVFTTMGNIETMVPMVLLILAYLLYKKQRRNALFLAFGVGGAALANVILKFFFQRDRPSLWESLIIEHGYSFPSGHAMASSALVFCLVVLLWNTRYRLAAIIIGAIVMILVGMSRLYFGVHYPSDILAGWSVSFVWVAITALIVKGYSYFKVKNVTNVTENK